MAVLFFILLNNQRVVKLFLVDLIFLFTKKLGLIDRIGNYDDAVQWAGRLGGIQGEISTMHPPKPPLNILEELIQNEIHSWITKILAYQENLSIDYLCPYRD